MAGATALCIALIVAASPSPAQEVTGAIVGNVTDHSGAAVAGVKITVTATDQNRVARTVVSNSNGEFVAPLLPIGRYSVSTDAKGFKRLVRGGIDLHVDEKLTLPLRLEVGDVTEQVTVESSEVQVDLQSPTAAGLISGTEVRELSLNNRNYLELLTLMPGVTSNSPTDELSIGTTNPTGATNSLPFSINGGRTTGNNFMVDGADNMDRGANSSLLTTPSVDAIAEFKALRGVYSAEFGRGASGQINVITKSGGSGFHGDLYEFFRNDKLAANAFFNNANRIALPPLRYNNFGYTLSGPIYIPGHYNRQKNKTFFFWSQEFRRSITSNTFSATAPTDAMKKGLFSAPVCVAYSGSTCQQTANSISNINPVAAEYIQDIWSKIPEGNPNDFTLFTSQRFVYNYRQELIKIDHVFGPKLALSGRYVSDGIHTEEPTGYQINDPLPGVATTQTQSPGTGLIVRAVSSFSSTFLNEGGFAYSGGAKLSHAIGLDSQASSPDVKVALPYPSTLDRVPGLSISGASAITGYGPYVNYSRNYNAFDNLTKILGKHTLKFGAVFDYYQKTENAATTNAGSFAFASTPRPTGTTTLAQGWANFLLGNASTYTQTSLDLQPDMRQREFEAYVQDDFRIASNLTLNLGVRYSIFRLPYDDKNFLTNFDPNIWDPAKAPQINAANGNIVVGTGDPLNGIIINNKNSPYGNKVANEPGGRWAPRVGFAWDPFRTGKTSIRSGYGIAYDSTLVGMYENNIFSNPPYLDNITISNTRLENPAAGVTVISAAPKTLRGTPLPAAIPYTGQWSFDVQRQVGSNWLVAAGYYGSKSTHLLGIVDINQVYPGLAVAAGIVNARTPISAATAPMLNTLRPFPGYGPINQVENWFNSNYHSLQVTSQKRFAGYSTLRLAYTWSKVMTDAGSDRNNAPQNFYDRAADYARAPFDRTQVLSVSYIYQIPFARTLKGTAHAIMDGWQVSGIVSGVTGLPLRATSNLGLDWAGLGFTGSQAAARPDRVADPNAGAPRTTAQWFNTKAFAAVPTGQIRPGNAAATTVAGPGYQQWDLSLFRAVKVRENMLLQIRGETFNLLNHVNFTSVATSFGDANFGQVLAAREPRRIQIGLKLIF